MRFNPDHDPDPARHALEGVTDYNELPEKEKVLLQEAYEKVRTLFKSELKTDTDLDPMLLFMAFSQLQISSLQREVVNSRSIHLILAQHIDELRGEEGDE